MAVSVSNSPVMYDETLSDVLQRARTRVAEVERRADERVALAEERAVNVEREAQARQAHVEREVEEQVRAALALSAPPLQALRVDLDEEPFEREAPPVPSMAELLRPTPGVTRFLDSLYGEPDR